MPIAASSPQRLLPPLRIGRMTIQTPVILAPMAGITNAAFRRLCREHGGGLYVAEMVTSRALVERTPESLRIIHHDPDETPRSVQLYGVDPATIGAAVRMLVEEDLADHIDMNFGCPVPKVTRKGGGAVLPWKSELFREIVRAAVRAASTSRRAGHGQDAQGDRRRPPDLPRGGADGGGRGCRGRRAPRTDRRGLLLRPRRLEGDRAR